MTRSSATRFRSAAVAVALLVGLARPALAQASAESGAPAPDAGWQERDYLLHYAAVVCVQGAYGMLKPAPTAALDALGREAWAMVELTRRAPETYARIHDMAMARGKGEAPDRALAACRAWAMRDAAAILRPATPRR
jgi:hypothetical protein